MRKTYNDLLDQKRTEYTKKQEEKLIKEAEKDKWS